MLVGGKARVILEGCKGMRVGGLGWMGGGGIDGGEEEGVEEGEEEEEEEEAQLMVDDFDRPGAGAAGVGSENWRYVDGRDGPRIGVWKDLLVAKRREWWGKNVGDDDAEDRQESRLSEEELRNVREIWETET